jgi:hypothetical protein
LSDFGNVHMNSLEMPPDGTPCGTSPEAPNPLVPLQLAVTLSSDDRQEMPRSIALLLKLDLRHKLRT